MSRYGVRERVKTWLPLRGRTVMWLAGDVALLVLSLTAAVWLRFDGIIPARVMAQLPLAIALSLVTKIAVFATQGLYSLSWSQAGLEDGITIFRGVGLGCVVFSAVVIALRAMPALGGFSRSVLVVDYVITLYVVGVFRLGRRLYTHVMHRFPREGRRALIVGAGLAGDQLVRSLRGTPASGYAPVGFIDDDPEKLGTAVRGLRVLGSRGRLPEIIREHGIDAVLIAMPTARPQVVRDVVAVAHEAGVREIRIIPALERILNGRTSVTDLREIQLDDLLGRDVVRIDTVAVGQWLRGQTVLVTGAGGSIGSELCRQVARFHPHELVLMDCDETALFWVEKEMRRLGQRCAACLLDIRDVEGVREAFARARPRVVFHAAAYKHVGLLERFPEQAIRTNIVGTRTIAEAAAEAGVEKFVLISTDKAVNPSSVMGASKRVAEQVCLALNGRASTRYIAVRFGNVLGSRGSVVPIFQENIRRGEPLIIRGSNMRRYFMAVSEAVLLVLQAGVAGRGGEVFVLDMGEPIRIVDLAHELIRLSGLKPEMDVPIVFAEPEPGEKEYEDLLTAEEGTVATQHDRIFVARGCPRVAEDDLFARVNALEEMVGRHDLHGAIDVLRTLVPSYHPSELIQRLGLKVPSA